MLVKAIKTRALIPPKDDLLSVIRQSFLSAQGGPASGWRLKEKSVVVVTSKVVSIWRGDCLKISQIKDKDSLIKKEADLYIDRTNMSPESVMLTIKDNILIPTSGIDESNANGYYIMWPKNPANDAKEIYQYIKKEFKLKNFGVIISDSHTTPLRTGIMGIGIAYYGFYPLRDYRNKKDIFGRKLKMSQTNIVDSLCASAVYEMGEGSEQTPIAVIEGVGNIKFETKTYKKDPLLIGIDEDIYSPFLKSVKWKKYKK